MTARNPRSEADWVLVASEAIAAARFRQLRSPGVSRPASEPIRALKRARRPGMSVGAGDEGRPGCRKAGAAPADRLVTPVRPRRGARAMAAEALQLAGGSSFLEAAVAGFQAGAQVRRTQHCSTGGTPTPPGHASHWPPTSRRDFIVSPTRGRCGTVTSGGPRATASGAGAGRRSRSKARAQPAQVGLSGAKAPEGAWHR